MKTPLPTVRLVISAQDARALARNLSKLAKLEGRKSSCAVIEFDLCGTPESGHTIHVCDARAVGACLHLNGRNPFFSVKTIAALTGV